MSMGLEELEQCLEIAVDSLVIAEKENNELGIKYWKEQIEAIQEGLLNGRI